MNTLLQITIFLTMAKGGRNLRINPFNVDEDHIATGEKWDEWLEELEREMRFFRISDAADRKDAMLIYGGVDIRRLEKSLQDLGDGDLYTKLKGKLTDYFSPKKNIHYSRYIFLKMRPLIGESTIAYAARLREKAVNCEFHDRDERMLEHIIQTSDNSELIRKVLHKKWTLQQTLAEMQVLEDMSMQVEAMGHQNSTNVSKINRKRTDKHRYPAAEQNNTRGRYCRYCGRTHPMKKELCPAYGKFCSKCGKSNHFATVCLSTADQSNRTHQKPSRNSKRDVRRASNESDSDSQIRIARIVT